MSRPDAQDPAEQSDRALLQAHVDGDADAFGRLFTRHRDRLWAVALRTMGHPEDAADALQDALISAYRRAETFRGESQVTTWLHRIVVNACLDRLRSNKVRAAEPLPDDLDAHTQAGTSDASGSSGTGSRGSLVTREPDREADPEQAAMLSERRRQVVAALAELPGDQRAAVVLVDMEGYPVAEAARILDCPVGTVKSRCARARARLAGSLGMLVEGADPDESDTQRNQPPSGPVPSPRVARGPPE